MARPPRIHFPSDAKHVENTLGKVILSAIIIPVAVIAAQVITGLIMRLSP